MKNKEFERKKQYKLLRKNKPSIIININNNVFPNKRKKIKITTEYNPFMNFITNIKNIKNNNDKTTKNNKKIIKNKNRYKNLKNNKIKKYKVSNIYKNFNSKNKYSSSNNIKNDEKNNNNNNKKLKNNNNKIIKKKKKNKKKKNKIICNNCGKEGHVYKLCDEPKISLGIICYRLLNNDIQFLMIQRKDTYSYVEFIRGIYSLYNIEYLKKIIENMTKIEILKIMNYNFDSLWDDFWSIKRIDTKHLINNLSSINDTYQIDKNRKRSERSKKTFEKSKQKFIQLKQLNILKQIIKEYPPKWDTPEWGFPKGRRNIKETDDKCAIREFKEETNLSEEDFTIRSDIKQFVEIYNGSNNLKYKHIYFIAEVSKNNEKCNNIYSNNRNLNQNFEISDINWFSYNDALNKIRPYHYRKCQILTRLYLLLKNKSKSKNKYLKNTRIHKI